MKIQSSDQLIEKAQEVLDEEGVTQHSITKEQELEEFIVPGIKNSKNTLEAIYFTSRDRSGLIGKLKTKIQQVIISTVINVIEKQSMRQQKFNNLTYKALNQLVEENKQLKARIEKLEK